MGGRLIKKNKSNPGNRNLWLNGEERPDFAIVLKWSDDTEKTESCYWLSKGSGGPEREPGRKHSTAISSGGSKIAIKQCL